jgi:hypothetical protein
MNHIRIMEDDVPCFILMVVVLDDISVSITEISVLYQNA